VSNFEQTRKAVAASFTGDLRILGTLLFFKKGGLDMELILKLDRDDARVLSQLLDKMTELTWPPQCDVYSRISDKLLLAVEEAGCSIPDDRFDVIAQ
jgi:hypothetical protein